MTWSFIWELTADHLCYFKPD